MRQWAAPARFGSRAGAKICLAEPAVFRIRILIGSGFRGPVDPDPDPGAQKKVKNVK